jgi:hypothetical protein
LSLTIEKKIDGRHGVTFLWKYFSQLDGSVVLNSSGYISDEDDELGEDRNYLDVIQSPSYSYLKKRFKGRRLICRVLLHELCHLKIKEHSHHYWYLIHKFMPNYHDKIEWLNVNGSNLL